jgi:BspA type Leucine rich repeat region (6 copies)
VRAIGHSTFFRCTSLERIHIPASVTKIEKFMLYGCESLKSLTFAPDSECALEYLGKAFIGRCHKLERFSLPPSVTQMSGDAFGTFHFLSPRIQLPWGQFEGRPGSTPANNYIYPVLTMAFVLLQRAGKENCTPIHLIRNDD